MYGWQLSGNANGGSVEVDPGPTSRQGVNGVAISNVLAESLHYKYGVYLRRVSRSVLTNVGSYDYHGNGAYVAAIGLHSCDGLTIIAGYDDLDGIKPYVTVAEGSSLNNWRDMATLIHSSQSVNAPGTSISAKFTAWNGVTTRATGGGAGTQLAFSRLRDATTGPQAGFAQYGTKWQTDGTGGPMSIDTGTGGSYFDLKAYGMRWYSQAGTLLGTFGAGKQGFALGADGDVTFERHAAGIGKSNGRFRGNGGLSTALAAEPVLGTIDNGECVFRLDSTPGTTKLKIVDKDSGDTVRRGEIALT